jgi:hypothetical protein
VKRNSARKKRVVGLGRPILIVTVVGLLAVAAMGAGSCGKSGSETKTGSLGDTSTTAKPGEANPDGTYSLTCGVRLGDFTEGPHGYRFVADGTLKNTGNIGIVVHVTGRWELKGAPPVTTTQNFKLDIDENQKVQMTVPSSQQEVDAHKKAGSHCKTNIKILRTFGKPISKPANPPSSS